MFYTRIPCPKWVKYSGENLNKASMYFPIIGWIMGAFASASFFIGEMVWGNFLAVLLGVIATIWATGAFHEDGFADMLDGFGGGWTKEKILDIMKDSRLGTYGAVGLVLLLSLKIAALYQIAASQQLPLFWVWVCGHTWSRFTAISFVFTDEYVREDELSKSKPIAKKFGVIELLMALLFALIPLIGLYTETHNLLILLIIPISFIIKYFLGKWFNKWIGGFTGDCLGATQQMIETAIYLFLASKIIY